MPKHSLNNLTQTKHVEIGAYLFIFNTKGKEKTLFRAHHTAVQSIQAFQTNGELFTTSTGKHCKTWALDRNECFFENTGLYGMNLPDTNDNRMEENKGGNTIGIHFFSSGFVSATFPKDYEVTCTYFFNYKIPDCNRPLPGFAAGFKNGKIAVGFFKPQRATLPSPLYSPREPAAERENTSNETLAPPLPITELQF